MKYLVGMGTGLVIGIFLYMLWKKVFGKYLPSEDAFLLKLICSAGYYFIGIIDGALFTSMNIFAICIGFFLLFIVFAISYAFGIYYKIIATKKIHI